jgi:hypothetical protein
MVNKKSAPQKTVKDISRVGNWGGVEYHHTLECGHVEIRKRPAKTEQIACTWCVVAVETGRQLRTLTVVPPPVMEELWDFYDQDIVDEVSIARMQSALASAFGCPNESVEIVSSIDDDGRLSVNYATVLLDYEQIKKIVLSQRNTVDI